MRYFTYILQSQQNGSFYIGQTQDLSARLGRHNKGMEKYTSKFKPWNLVWYGCFESRKEAFQMEQKL
ncbi:MAG: GIY-YIG nuclease family protein, partial [Bacteroidetes bacterium]|nr:GIY-YIG nuclease family protein [Bacteroidota bacterium]